jgi:Ca2+-binding EF-hand superfamily protein
MRIAAVGSLLLFATMSFAQGPGGGFGGFGGFGGGRGGGGGFDPNQLFDRMSNGKDVVSRADITNPFMQGMFDRFAQQAGVTNGQLTREQFVTAMQQRMGQRGQRGGGPGGGGNEDPNAAANSWIERSFRRMDANGDGLLNYDEMDENLRIERDKWDANKDGFIDLNEYKAYSQARMQQMQAERGGGQAGGGGSGGPIFIAAPPEPEEEEKRPAVYRAGNLPPGMPAWFSQLDTDRDGQVGLYEWRAAGRTIGDFEKIDRNGDGFLTIDEVLRYEKLSGSPTALASAGGSQFPEDARQQFNPGGGQNGMQFNRGNFGPRGFGGFGQGGQGPGGFGGFGRGPRQFGGMPQGNNGPSDGQQRRRGRGNGGGQGRGGQGGGGWGGWGQGGD